MDNEYKDQFYKNLGNNIKTYLAMHKMSQLELAQKLDVTPAAVSTWCVGIRAPRMDKIDAMCKIFSCTRSDLMEKPGKSKSSSWVKINVLGRVAAGSPTPAVEDIIGEEEIPERLAVTGEFFGLMIKGDSMEPTFTNGDIAIVRKQNDAENGDIVVALVNGYDAVCKKLHKYSNGLSLVSLNPAYEPMIFTKAEIDTVPVSIVGKVVELRRKF